MSPHSLRLIPRDEPENDSHAPRILAVVGTLTGLAGLIVLLRIYARGRILKRCGMDDYIILFALACSFAVLGCFIAESHHGLGKLTIHITSGNQQLLRKITYYHSILVMVGISAVKVSLGFFLLRVAAQSSFRRFIIGAIIFLLAFTVACMGTLIFECTPVSGAWDYTLVPAARCFSLGTFEAIGVFNSSVNIVTDVIFATLPIPMFYGIRVNKRSKASLMAILSLGYFACAAAIVKLVAQINVFHITNSYRDSTFTLWNAIELNIGIIAASLPTIRPLVKSLLGATRSLTNGSRSRSRKRTQGYISHHGSIFAMNSLAQRNEHADIDGGRKYDVTITAPEGSSLHSEGTGSEEGFAGGVRNGNIHGGNGGGKKVGFDGTIMTTTEVIVQRESSFRLGPKRDVDDCI